MRITSLWATSLLLGLCASGCVLADFKGDHGHVGFRSNLGRDFPRWTPQQPVAVGSHLEITAMYWDGSDDGGVVVPQVVVGSLDEPQHLPNRLLGRLSNHELVRVDWSGTTNDAFTITADDAVAGKVGDPVLAGVAAIDQPVEEGSSGVFTWTRGGPWADVGSVLRLVVGAPPLRLNVLLHGADGGTLGAGDVDMVFRSDQPYVSVENVNGLLSVTASAQGAPAHVTAEFDGREMASLMVVPVRADEVSLTGLSVVESRDTEVVALRAGATTLDGGTVWQAPFAWDEDGFEPVAAVHRTPSVETRTDIRVLVWAGDDAGPGTFVRPVIVHLGAQNDEQAFTVVTPEPRHAGVDATATPIVACACANATAPALPASLLLASFGWMWAATRRPRRATR